MPMYKISVCYSCGHKERILVYTQEEARSARMRLVRPQCKSCGSYKVVLEDE